MCKRATELWYAGLIRYGGPEMVPLLLMHNRMVVCAATVVAIVIGALCIWFNWTNWTNWTGRGARRNDAPPEQHIHVHVGELFHQQEQHLQAQRQLLQQHMHQLGQVQQNLQQQLLAYGAPGGGGQLALQAPVANNVVIEELPQAPAAALAVAGPAAGAAGRTPEQRAHKVCSDIRTQLALYDGTAPDGPGSIAKREWANGRKLVFKTIMMNNGFTDTGVIDTAYTSVESVGKLANVISNKNNAQNKFITQVMG